MTEDIKEIDVWLNPHDMDHLEAGQPVFKPGPNDTLLVLRTTGWDDE